MISVLQEIKLLHRIMSSTSNISTVNKNETLCVIFHRKQKKLATHSESFNLGKVTAEKVHNVKFLSMLLDQRLSWVVHITNAARKLWGCSEGGGEWGGFEKNVLNKKLSIYIV